MNNLRLSHKGLFTLIAKRFMGPFWYRRQQLNKTQWYSKEKLDYLQLELLKKIINHAYNTVPYYFKLFNSRNLKPNNIKTLTDIQKIPILRKKDIRNAGKSLVSTKYPPFFVRRVTTGGTTGISANIYRDLFSISNEHAFVLRQKDFAGLSLRDKCAFLTAREIVRPGQYKRRYYFYDPFMKELILSTYHLNYDSAIDYAHLIKEYKVDAIVSYPSAINFFAQVCKEANIKIRLKGILTTSETMSEETKHFVSEIFNCNVFDYYGAAERVCYIHTCEYGNYHIIPEYGLTELIPIENIENTYKVVATGFWNKAMPLIRYDTGDLVKKTEKKCKCKREFGLVDFIIGRTSEVIKTPTGEIFGPTLIIHMFYIITQKFRIPEIQIVQDTLNHATIRYVTFGKLNSNENKLFVQIVRKYIPKSLDIELEEVDFIKRTVTGKLRPIISLL